MDDWKIIHTSTLPQDIYLARAYLESEGIPTLLRDELTVQVQNFYSNAIGGVKLLVPEVEFDRAKELLRGAGYETAPGSAPAGPLPWVRTAARDRCPFCGSTNIRKKKEADWLMLAFYALLGVLLPIFRPVWTCFDCGKSWRFK